MGPGVEKNGSGIGDEEEDAGRLGGLSKDAKEGGEDDFAVEEVVETSDDGEKEEGFGRTNRTDDEITSWEKEKNERGRESDFDKVKLSEQFIEEDSREDARDLGREEHGVGIGEEREDSGEEADGKRKARPVGGVIDGGKGKFELASDGLRLIEGFSGDDIIGAVVVGDDGGHAIPGERNAPEGGEAEVEGEPDSQGSEERKEGNDDVVRMGAEA